MKNDILIKAFKNWMHTNGARLFELESSRAADEIAKRLETISPGLGVEVQRLPVVGIREMIITAFSNAALFEQVRQIATSLSSLPLWRVVALKPPRGFAFRISVGAQKLNASELSFEPIPELGCAFQLIVPDQIVSGKEAEEIAWLTVETGIGEELASRIQHLEFAHDTSNRGRAISDLAAYLEEQSRSAHNSLTK